MGVVVAVVVAMTVVVIVAGNSFATDSEESGKFLEF